jgi:hypothetical protein
MSSNNGFKEVRFKVRDSPFQRYKDMALYLFDMKIIDKPTIHEFARWCLNQTTDLNALKMFQWKLAREMQTQEQHNTMLGNQQVANYVQNGPISSQTTR